jgi:hypothetical protein
MRGNNTAAVHFNFSTGPELVISEGGDLPSQLFINKNGQHQGNITVEVVLRSTFQNQNGMCGGMYCITTKYTDEIF